MGWNGTLAGDEMEWGGMGLDEMEWDGVMIWDGLGWDGVGWVGVVKWGGVEWCSCTAGVAKSSGCVGFAWGGWSRLRISLIYPPPSRKGNLYGKKRVRAMSIYSCSALSVIDTAQIN